MTPTIFTKNRTIIINIQHRFIISHNFRTLVTMNPLSHRIFNLKIFNELLTMIINAIHSLLWHFVIC